jgi:AcrR family transcriptional regulator
MGDGQVTTTSPRDAGHGSPAQRERRRRILDATVTLASQGGYDAVQMRAVAEHADVALGTLYRYFPSKVHLLVSTLARELEHAVAGLEGKPVPGDSAADRVLYVLDEGTSTFRGRPRLTEGVTRAFMFADSSVADDIRVVERYVGRMILLGIRAEGATAEATEEELAIVKVVGDVWLASLVQWVTGRSSLEDVRHSVELAVRLLLR